MSSLYRIPGAVIYLLFCCLLSTAGEEVVKLQELEGNTVIIHTGLTAVQSDAKILWFYGPEKADINIVDSQVFRGETVIDYNTERFRDRLKLNRNSGSLTIRNISREDSGLYKLLVILTSGPSDWSFRVNVYAPVLKPVIRNGTENCSVSLRDWCSPLCTVENEQDVNLSWFKDNERISNISSTVSSDCLSLPLNITISNCSTYTCVAANPVSNQTTQLKLTQLCYNKTERSAHDRHIIIPLAVLIGLCVIAAGSLILFKLCCKEKTEEQLLAENGEADYPEVKITSPNSKEAYEGKVSRETKNQDQSETVVYSHIKF
ncbi:CD48 antigen-like isoform X2 [Hoplias malabaricus]|uniref:CD48 antigen-like isoform X2 n=1 Tax=Hoplias malabaricus TaxID=27720 RepID=UPI003462DAA0